MCLAFMCARRRCHFPTCVLRPSVVSTPTGSRFYARALAELITSRGRDALQHAVDIATNQNLEVRARLASDRENAPCESDSYEKQKCSSEHERYSLIACAVTSASL
eukprot:6197973-Pleurochrysis_carterae.AAC.5